MKQKQLNLTLGVLALGLLAGLWFSQKKEAPKGPPLTALSADAIDKITLQHPKSPDIVLEKKDGHWALTAPVQVPADGLEVRSLTDLATLEAHTSMDAKDVKLADLGLDPPAYDIVLNDQRLDFGNVETISYHRYIKTGDKIALVDDPPGSALDADYSDLVSKNLLPEDADIASIAVPGLSVARSADGKSWTATPADPKASSDAVQKFVEAWTGARSLWNTDAKADVKSVDPKAGTVTVTLKNGQALSFAIASRDPQFVLERADLKVRYNLAKDAADSMLKLQEPAPLPAPVAPVAPDKAAENPPSSPLPAVPVPGK